MSRVQIPKKVKDTVLDEFNHRCAICGCDRPHVHHIDEDATNNEIINLIPLCPNHHLSDQHNPTRKIDIEKLKLFRRHKDPAILLPEFHPIFTRSKFLKDIESNYEDINDLEERSESLIKFVSVLNMGEFYGSELRHKIGYVRANISIMAGKDENGLSAIEKHRKKYRDKLIENRDESEALLVELLRYQKWEWPNN